MSIESVLPLDLRAAGSLEVHCDQVLGAVTYGRACEMNPVSLGCVPLEVLPAGGCAETAWLSHGPFVDGQCGSLCYRHNHVALFGYITLDEADFPSTGGRSALQQVSEAAYTAIFETLTTTGFRHLARCWNYLPRINADGGGMERYRQFNIGRQDAFVAAGRAHRAGAPSACALGTANGELVVYFIATHTEPLAIENPRQVSAYSYPQNYGPRSPTFSRASLLPLPGLDVLFISGTASIVGHETVHEGDVVAQTAETLRNLEVLVEQANRRSAIGGFAVRDLRMKIFVRHPEDQVAVADTLQCQLGSDLDVVWLRADICRAELLVEIEAFGFRARGTE